MNTSFTYLAPAKINLFLHITGRRTDGYHNLQSIFQFVDFYDKIQLSVTDHNRITRISQLDNVPAEQDLCVRAALALQQATGCTQGVEIQVEKNIPMGGGLGGGSSDAATMLLALNQLWALNLNRQQLMAIGHKLGADVPVFIFGQSAWAEGIGEQLTPLALPKSFYDQYYVVVTPPVHISTAYIFSNSRLTRDTKPLKIADFSNPANSSCFKNDLEKIVCEEFPAVATTMQWLSQFGQARMSGSGASVFVGVSSKQEAENILKQKPYDMFGFVAKGLKYHPHYELTH
ncbi:MAG: 4-(cytidine 5'-diphospho)-2-C-methyl-D-erythritol kinase [Methylophilus sp.]|nr:4-(cytidine 5'-diphospho)-2-C-methyl-D-erythritol kinase [Methylophilus sp.]